MTLQDIQNHIELFKADTVHLRVDYPHLIHLHFKIEKVPLKALQEAVEHYNQPLSHHPANNRACVVLPSWVLGVDFEVYLYSVPVRRVKQDLKIEEFEEI